MADLTQIPLQDGFETFLTQELSSSGLVAYCNSVGNFTFPSGETTTLVLNPGKSNMEIVPISAKDTSAKTFTIDSRNLSQGNGVTTTAQTHAVGSKVIISDNYKFWKDIQTAVNSKLDESGGTFTGEIDFSGTTIGGLRVNNLTTTQRDALSSPVNGMIIYNTTTGVMNQYIGGAWTTFATGATSNASETVAGKVELATTTEFDAGTDTGATGAKLVAVPSMFGATTAEITQLSGTTNIAEADTFFGATDITGAQAETLSDGSDAEDLHKHQIVGAFINGEIAIGAATGNTDTAVTTAGTPQATELDITFHDRATGFNAYCRVFYEGTTQKWAYKVYGAGTTALTYRLLAGSQATNMLNTALSLVSGTGGDTQTITFSIVSLSSTGETIRITNTKAGTGGGVVDVHIGYKIFT